MSSGGSSLPSKLPASAHNQPSPSPSAIRIHPRSQSPPPASQCPSHTHDDTRSGRSPPLHNGTVVAPTHPTEQIQISPSPERSLKDSQAAATASSTPNQSYSLEYSNDPRNGCCQLEGSWPPPTSNLHISTDVAASFTKSPSLRPRRSPIEAAVLSPPRQPYQLRHQASANSLRLTRTPSLKAALAGSIGSAGSASGTDSAIPSPIITAMGDMTPLPSPIMLHDSPGPWKKLAIGSLSPPARRDKLRSVGEEPDPGSSAAEADTHSTDNAPSKRKLYRTLQQTGDASAVNSTAESSQRHNRNRSVSDYTADSAIMSARPVTASGSHLKINCDEPQIKREQNFAEARGLTPSIAKPPTPPPSESSRDSTDGGVSASRYEWFEARGRKDKKMRRWRSICTVGQGTFSRVCLATSQLDIPDDVVSRAKPDNLFSSVKCGIDRKTLVAVKVCEHGPRGGASEDRVEMSLKRELEIMQSIHHPSLVNLKAWNIEPTRAILILTYCPGGDLFDVATVHKRVLSPPLIRRIFAELVGAVKYLHQEMIVHRDIKLENVLVNLTPDELTDPSVDWQTYPYSVVSLADLGLSRRITEDEKLETRCGSEDYAAPEVIMGQTYDGRATDAWSLGVLLYALLESRLPFDPHPGMNDSHRMRSRKSHRIARVEWRWFVYEGDDTDHDGSEARFEEKGLLGAMNITEGLLRRARGRLTLDKVSANPWVSGGIAVDGGLKFGEEVEGVEV